MPGPRLLLHFGSSNCFPLSNCTQSDNLIALIRNIEFEEDGSENGMSCAQASGSYTLMCRNFYDTIATSLSSNSSIETSALPEQVTWILIGLCVLIIVFLLLNTARLARKIKYYEQKEAIFDDEENEIPLEKNKSMLHWYVWNVSVQIVFQIRKKNSRNQVRTKSKHCFGIWCIENGKAW